MSYPSPFSFSRFDPRFSFSRFDLLLTLVLLTGSGLVLAGCSGSTNSSANADAAGASEITDAAYLAHSKWNDGQAEVAFYRVERSINQYGEKEDQVFMLGSYLVKHDFDPEAMSKAGEGASGRVPAFKFSQFYEFDSGSYQYKYNYVVNARRSDLRPIKHSFTSFDWCSNQYREMAFQPDGTVETLMRSDDYGNDAGTFDYRANAYTPSQIPLLVRALDFSEEAGSGTTRSFSVVTREGEYVSAEAELAGTETVETAAGSFATDRIDVTYEEPVPSTIAAEPTEGETYWRAQDTLRHLIRQEGADGTYGMELVEKERLAYWSENVWTRLERVAERP